MKKSDAKNESWTLNNNTYKSALKSKVRKTLYKHWTKSEINFLRINYKRKTAREISERLGRPIQAIFSKAKSLGIQKSPRIMFKPQTKKVVPPVKKEVKVKEVAKTEKNNKYEKFNKIALLISSIAIALSITTTTLLILH